jgi:predicted porin
MKTKLSILAASISLAMTAGVAQAEGPIDGKVYGKVNLSLQSTDEGTDSRVTELVSNASRLGFKGETKINDDLSAIYQLEYEASIDDGENKGQTFTQRNSFVGLKGAFGTVKAGIHDTPTKLAQDKVDLFNDYEGDIKNVFSGENRAENILFYTTPDMGGITADIAMIASEDDNEDDAYSLAVKFSQDNIYAALAFDQDVEGEGTNTMRLVTKFSLEDLTLGLMWNSFEDENADFDEDAFMVSAAYKMGSNTFKIQHATGDIKAAGREQTSLGLDHKLAKNTKVFGFYTMQDEDAANKDKDWFAVGIEHKF